MRGVEDHAVRKDQGSTSRDLHNVVHSQLLANKIGVSRWDCEVQ